MKNRLWLLIFLLALIGCTNSDEFQVDSIVADLEPPIYKNESLLGTWSLKDKLKIQDGEGSTDAIEKIYISSEYVQIGDKKTDNPHLKSRYINFSDFLKYKYTNLLVLPDSLYIEGPVYTISDGQFFYQELMKLDDDSLGLLSNGSLLIYQKQSQEVDEEIIKIGKLELESRLADLKDNSLKEESKDLGLLLGIKSARTDTNANRYFEYKSLFVKIEEDEANIYGAKHLFLPRDSGFWSIGMDHLVDVETTRDVIFSYPIAGATREQNTFFVGNKNANQIQYLSKNYISLESRDYDSSVRNYGIYDLNHLSENKKLDIVDIGGEDGLNSYMEETVKVAGDNGITENLEGVIDTKNIGLRRTNGKWEFKSNLMSISENQLVIMDYGLDIVPQIGIMDENNFAVAWDGIKTKIPNLMDAHTSPYGEVLVAQIDNEIQIYRINNQIISARPILSIQSTSDDRIIMCEWSSGETVGVWEENFLRQNRIPVKTLINYNEKEQ